MRRYHAIGGSFAREVKAEARPKRGKGMGKGGNGVDSAAEAGSGRGTSSRTGLDWGGRIKKKERGELSLSAPRAAACDAHYLTLPTDRPF